MSHYEIIILCIGIWFIGALIGTFIGGFLKKGCGGLWGFIIFWPVLLVVGVVFALMFLFASIEILGIKTAEKKQERALGHRHFPPKKESGQLSYAGARPNTDPIIKPGKPPVPRVESK